MTTRSRAAAWLIAVFVIGLTAGIAIGYEWFYQPPSHRSSNTQPHHRDPAEVAARINTKAGLNLSADQLEQLKKIIEESHDEFRKADEESRTRFEQVRRQGRGRILEILNPEQVTLFNNFIAKEEDRRKAKEAN